MSNPANTSPKTKNRSVPIGRTPHFARHSSPVYRLHLTRGLQRAYDFRTMRVEEACGAFEQQQRIVRDTSMGRSNWISRCPVSG